MVDIKELRIGNIVECYSSLHKKNKPFEVNQILVDNIELIDTDESFEILYDRLDGIPLTEELLLKCGFTKEYYGFSCDIVELSYGCFLHNDGIDNDKLFLSTHNAEYSISRVFVGYLHQLQNICYALTGKELNVELINL
jgi:hypothetical protein